MIPCVFEEKHMQLVLLSPWATGNLPHWPSFVQSLSSRVSGIDQMCFKKKLHQQGLLMFFLCYQMNQVFERTVGSYEVRTGFYLQCFYLVVEVLQNLRAQCLQASLRILPSTISRTEVLERRSVCACAMHQKTETPFLQREVLIYPLNAGWVLIVYSKLTLLKHLLHRYLMRAWFQKLPKIIVSYCFFNFTKQAKV